MAAPPLMRSVRLALLLGAVGGTLCGACVGLRFGWLRVIGGAVLGMLLGAIAGLDLLIAGPSPEIGAETRSGPFRSAAAFTTGAAASFLACAFSLGGLTCDCTRRATGEVHCRRTTTAWFGQQVYGVRDFPDILQVVQVRPSMAAVITADPMNSSTIDGFGPTTAESIQSFLNSTETSLHLESCELWFFPWIFLGIGLVLSWLTALCLRWGRRELLKQLQNPDRRSATGF